MRKKSKIYLAAVLSVAAFVLMFILDDIFIGPRPIFALAHFKGTLLFLGCLGGYFLVAQYLLSRANPQAISKDWPIILALNWALLVAALVAMLVEHRHAVLETACVALFALACSFIGAALAPRKAPQ
jgi:hypothetical protein